MGGKDVSSNTKLGVLSILVIQNCSLILMMRYSRIAGDPNARYIISTAVVLSELLKFFASLIVLYFDKFMTMDCTVLSHIVRTDFMANSVEILKLAVPSGLYVVQNNLQYVSASNLPASVFQVLTQLKIVTTAFFSVSMLSRKLSFQQWLSILCLTGGVGMVQISQHMSTAPPSSTDNYMLGVTCVLFSCLTSGFAGVYFEKVLKSGRISLWLRNVHLSMIGVCLSTVRRTSFVQFYILICSR
jgi:solute carrier family 35 (UDP-sugar transporter), member A1/2/3